MSVAAAALVLVALALLHAASALEAALGLVVGAAICVAWLLRNVVRKREEASLTASSAEHLDIMNTVRLQHLLLVRLVWIVMALDLVFLIPWWIGGRAVHPIALTSVSSWLGMWLPMAGLIVLFVWSLRLWRHTRRELGAIDRVRSEPDEGQSTSRPIESSTAGIKRRHLRSSPRHHREGKCPSRVRTERLPPQRSTKTKGPAATSIGVDS